MKHPVVEGPLLGAFVATGLPVAPSPGPRAVVGGVSAFLVAAPGMWMTLQ